MNIPSISHVIKQTITTNTDPIAGTGMGSAQK